MTEPAPEATWTRSEPPEPVNDPADRVKPLPTVISSMAPDEPVVRPRIFAVFWV